MKLQTFSNMLHKLRVVEQKLAKEFEKSTGFSLTRYEILIFLKEHGDKLQVEIADYLDIDPAAVTRHVKILETKGYITKERNEANGREVIISLTDFAKSELARCKENQNKEDYHLPLPFTQEEINRLTEIVEKMEKKLN